MFDVLISFETWFDATFLESVDSANEQIVYEEQRKHTLSMLHQVRMLHFIVLDCAEWHVDLRIAALVCLCLKIETI